MYQKDCLEVFAKSVIGMGKGTFHNFCVRLAIILWINNLLCIFIFIMKNIITTK